MRMDYSIAIVWLILAFAIFGKWNSVRCEVFSSSELSSIDETIAELMSCRRIPGLGMSIAKQDQFLAKGYGVADVNEGTPMTEDTVMCIGSATKAFTSALLAVLITEDNKNGGTLSWTTTLREIFGEDFRLTSDPIISSQTTLEDILSHRSGVESTDAMLMAQLYSDQHRKSLLSRLHLLPTKGEFRGHFIYNNLMYGLAGLAAEAIGKRPYFELMKEKLLQPLNITSAVLADNMDYSQNLTSKPHQMVNGSVVLSDSRFFRLGSFSPAGALCLSPADLTKWLYFLNHYGTTLSQHRLINSLLFAKMISPKVSLDFMTQLSLGLFSKFPEPSYISWYALGWFGRFYRGDIDFLHGGSMFSYYSVVVMDPTSQTGIALTVNGLNPTILPYDLYPLAYFLKDILLGQTPWLNKTTICSYPAPWLPSSPRTPPKQAVQEKYVGSTCEFVGKFGHPLYGEVLITEKDQSLHFQWGNIMNGTLYNHKKSQFRLRLDDNVYLVLGSEFGSANIAFSNNSSGQYNNLKMTLSSLSETYDFRRGVSFDVSSPLSSPSSSTVSMRPQNTVSLSLYIIVFYFIKVLHSH